MLVPNRYPYREEWPAWFTLLVIAISVAGLLFVAFFVMAITTKMARAQLIAGGPTAYNCPTYDTTILSEGTGVVLSTCTLNTGPYSAAFIVASGEMTCDPGSIGGIILVAGFGPRPTQVYDEFGAHIQGSITGGVMTVTSMVTPFPQFRIAAGQTLNDAFGGTRIPNTGPWGSNLTVTGQLTSTEAGGILGGLGTYSVSSGSVTVPSQDIWSLNVGDPLGTPSSSYQISRGPLEPFFCQNGSTQIVTFAGSIKTIDADIPFVTAWVALLVSSQRQGANPIQSSSWKNGTISIMSLNFVGGIANGLGGAN